MSEALNKVRGVRELPLFPLPLVLFPGAPLPLHVFEPRYQQMLKDVQVGANMFGVSYFDASESDDDDDGGGGGGGEQRPPVGQAGCVAEVVEAQPLEDGRSNVLTLGLIRYEIESYVDTDEPYLIARVSFFEDEEEDAELLRNRAREVTKLFLRIARAVRTINNERAGLPDLPEAEPERLSFLVASAMEMEPDQKQELLEMRSTALRLNRLQSLLAQAVTNYEERARVHGIAKTNGHADKKLDLQ